MKTLSISIVYLSVKSLEIEDFEETIENFISSAKKNGANIILFPEYTFAPIISACDGDIFRASILTEKILASLSNHFKIIVVACGVFKVADNILNQTYFINGDELIYQPKINLIESEKRQVFLMEKI